MNRECCFTQVIKQIIKHHLWDLTVWLPTLELQLMVMLLLLRAFALETRFLWSWFFPFPILKVKFGWSDLSNSPHTNTQIIFFKWIQVDMTMPSTCHMRGSPPVQVFQFILMASYRIDLPLVLSYTRRFWSHQMLIWQKKKKKKKKRFFWFSLSGATNWVLAPPVDGISTVS